MSGVTLSVLATCRASDFDCDLNSKDSLGSFVDAKLPHILLKDLRRRAFFPKLAKALLPWRLFACHFPGTVGVLTGSRRREPSTRAQAVPAERGDSDPTIEPRHAAN